MKPKRARGASSTPKRRASSKRVVRRQTAKPKTGKRVTARAAASKIIVTEGTVTGKLTERERALIASRFGPKKPRQRGAVAGRVKGTSRFLCRVRNVRARIPSPAPGGASLPAATPDADVAKFDLGGDPIPPTLSGDVIPPKG